MMNPTENEVSKGKEPSVENHSPIIPEGTPTKECKFCSMQIPVKSKVCPYCRKRIRGRGIRIVLGSIAGLFVLIIVLAVAGGSSSDKDKGEASSVQRTQETELPTITAPPAATMPTATTAPTATATPAATSTPEPAAEAEGSVASRLYETISKFGQPAEFSITDNARQFLVDHSELFPTANNIDRSLLEESFDYRMMMKNNSNYGSHLVYFPSLYVRQIFEQSNPENNFTITQINAVDPEENSYWIYYLYKLENTLDGDYIGAYILPMATSSYSNLNGGKTLTVMAAGSRIVEQPERYEIKCSLVDNYMNTYRENIGMEYRILQPDYEDIVVSVWIDGTLELVESALNGSQEAVENWNAMVNLWKHYQSNISAMLNAAGFEDTDIWIEHVNEEDITKVLYSVDSKKVYLDIVNGINDYNFRN